MSVLTEWEDKWLLEEYKLLSAHYFHEDQTYFRVGGMLITVNGALIAFSATSTEVPTMPLVILVLFSLFGLSMTLAWAAMLLRIRALRLAITERLEEVETALQSHWVAAALSSPRIRLHMGNRITAAPGRLPSRWARRVPASITFLLVPIAAAMYWCALPFWRH